MSKKNKESGKAIRESVIKICVFGDINDKNKEFILNYSKGYDRIDKTDTIEFNKNIVGRPTKLIFFSGSTIEERVVPYVQENSCVFIQFDMSERTSFDNLLDKWLIWLRDTCKFEGKIVIFGDFNQQDSGNDFFLATSDDEVEEVIKCAELPQTTFLRIGDLSHEMKVSKIDDFLSTALSPVVEEVVNDQGGSLKDGCIII